LLYLKFNLFWMQKEDQLLLSQRRQSLFNHNSQILNLNDYRPLLCHQQDLLLYHNRAAGDTVTAGTKQSAGAGSLASAGEVPKRAKKQHPSQPPSRTGSSDATLVDPVSIAAESEAADVVLPPVPESISSGTGSPSHRRIDQPGQSDGAGQSMVGEEQVLQVHAKAYCQLCGSVNKMVEAGVTRCGRCMNSTFTDESREVLNWFDEEEKYDTECKRMSSQILHAEGELPHCRALRDVEATRQWHSSEVLIVKQLDQIPKARKTSEKDYPLTSYAAWFGAEETWLWGMVHNYFVEDGYEEVLSEQKEINPEHYVVFLQRSAPLKDDPIGTKAHMTLYRDRPCELVWLQRHGRDDIHKVGWDGSPKEMQSLFTNGNLDLQAYLLDAYHTEEHQQCLLIMDGNGNSRRFERRR